MKLSTAVSLAIFLAMLAFSLGDDFCCGVQSNCKNLTTLNITIKQFAEGSPYYEPILSSDEIAVDYQSVCVTFFPITNNLFIEFRAIEQINGSMIISVQLVSDLKPGVFRVQGLFIGEQGNTTTVQNAYIVDATCQSCQPTYMYYKCFLYDTCGDVIDPYDVVNGRSSSPDTAPSCLDAFESKAVSNKGFKVRGFTRPAGDSYSCVVQYGGSNCINYENVAPENMISYPLDDDVPTSC